MAERSYAIIIGAMRSGTTSLYEMLAEHPQICPCRTKEPHFFCDEQSIPYEDLWEYDETCHIYSLEASTNYAKYPMIRGVPDRIRAYGLRPKFIYLVRDPIDRIESQYSFMVNNKGKHVERFSEPRIIACSVYYLQLRQFLQVFSDRDQYLILDFESLISEPSTVLTACMTFWASSRWRRFQKEQVIEPRQASPMSGSVVLRG